MGKPPPSQPAVDGKTAADSTSVDALTSRNLRSIVEREQEATARIDASERVAVRVASFCGSMPFIWIHVAWFSLWIGLNTWLPNPFDPHPFGWLVIIVAMEAIFLAAFILIGQKHETRLSEQRSHLDLQINLLTEQENTQMLKMLRSIAAKVGADFEEHPDMAALEQATQPERLLEQIHQATQPEKKAAG